MQLLNAIVWESFKIQFIFDGTEWLVIDSEKAFRNSVIGRMKKVGESFMFKGINFSSFGSWNYVTDRVDRYLQHYFFN